MPAKKRGELAQGTLKVTEYSCELDGSPTSERETTALQGSRETIIYENTQKKQSSNCFHEKVSIGFRTGSICYDLASCYPGEDSPCAGTRRLVGHIAMYPLLWGHSALFQPKFFKENGEYDSTYFSSIGFDRAILNAEAFNTMKPSLDGGFSLTNFLLELRDMKTLFKLADKARSLIANMGSGYLNYQFGWKLLIQDAREVMRKFENWENILLRYLSMQGKPLKRHFAKKLVDNVEYEDSIDYVVNGNTYTTTRISTASITYHATMRYTYTIPTLREEYERTRAFREIWGLKLDASVVWEAVPFSFLIDWFVNVGEYLEGLSDEYLESKVTVMDYCTSIKITESTVTRTSGEGTNHDAAEQYFQLYDRRREVPNTDELGLRLSHRYGDKQMLLSSALLASRWG